MSQRIEEALERALSEVDAHGPPQVGHAIRYAVFPGGARVRPRLAGAVAEAIGGAHAPTVDAFGASLELLHCASLVHDDLPCFDDAATRRGKPSVHRIHGEPLALLAGDALIVLAFENLARFAAPSLCPSLVALLGRAAGAARGLVAGQAWESEPSIPIEAYHRAKTSSLFVAATQGGALAAGQPAEAWRSMGERLGDAYQVADDLFDACGDGDGKPAGQDAVHGRPNAVELWGAEGAVARLRERVAEAAAAVPECAGADGRRALVVHMAERLVPASLRQTAA